MRSTEEDCSKIEIKNVLLLITLIRLMEVLELETMELILMVATRASEVELLAEMLDAESSLIHSTFPMVHI